MRTHGEREERMDPRTSARSRRAGSSLARAIEGVVALALVVCATIQLSQSGLAMAEASLWNDEIASVRDFSEPGLWAALTEYPEPNNHIFFNALTAALDWSSPYRPLAARFWSYVAMGLLLLVGTAALARRGSLLEAGLFAHLVFMSDELVALGLQARGYGLLALFSLLAAVCAWRQQQEPGGSRGFVGLAIVAVLGVWTIPTFLFFVAPLMSFELLVSRRPRHFLLVAGSALTTLALHLPVASEMIEAQRRYAQDWGRQLAGVDPFFDALRLYLFHEHTLVREPNDFWLGTSLFAILVLAFARLPVRSVSVDPSRKADLRAARMVLGSVFAYFGALLALGTPPARTLAPVLVALVFGGLLALRARLWPTSHLRQRAALAGVLGVVLTPHDIARIDDFSLQPRESWLPVARFIDGVLPIDVAVTVPWRLEQLELYTDHRRVFHTSLAAGPIDRPGAVLLWSGLDPDPDHLARSLDPRLIAFRFDQNRGRHQTLLLHPPIRRSIRRISLVPRLPGESFLALDAAIDDDPASTVRLERRSIARARYFELALDLEDVDSLTSVVVELGSDTRVKRVEASWRTAAGRRWPIDEEDVIVKDASIAVVLDGAASRSIPGAPVRDADRAILEIHIKPRSTGNFRRLELNEVFAYRDERRDARGAARRDRGAPSVRR